MNRSSLRQHRCLFQLPTHVTEQSRHRHCIERKESISADVVPPSRHRPATQTLMLPITIDAGMVTPLRRAVIGACGDMLRFLRIQSIADSNKVKVWLCLIRSGIDLTVDAIMCILPAAEFGRITPV
jgi:hypothetical protein